MERSKLRNAIAVISRDRYCGVNLAHYMSIWLINLSFVSVL